MLWKFCHLSKPSSDKTHHTGRILLLCEDTDTHKYMPLSKGQRGAFLILNLWEYVTIKFSWQHPFGCVESPPACTGEPPEGLV